MKGKNPVGVPYILVAALVLEEREIGLELRVDLQPVDPRITPVRGQAMLVKDVKRHELNAVS
jgi:hypothetical protein